MKVKHITLRRYTLNASSEYGVEVMVIDANGLNNTAVATVVVGRSALVALIAGGDRIVGISEESLELDASGSYDPDAATTALAVVWSCEVVKENAWDPGVCGGNLTEDAMISQPLSAYGAGTFSFTAFVVSSDGRNTTANVMIEVGGVGSIDGGGVCLAEAAAVGNKCARLSVAWR